MAITKQTPEGEKQLRLTIQCPKCRKEKEIVVEAAAFNKWRNGTLMQEAFPNMSRSDREDLITGLCSSCWDLIFTPDYDDGDKEMT